MNSNQRTKVSQNKKLLFLSLLVSLCSIFLFSSLVIATQFGYGGTSGFAYGDKPSGTGTNVTTIIGNNTNTVCAGGYVIQNLSNGVAQCLPVASIGFNTENISFLNNTQTFLENNTFLNSINALLLNATRLTMYKNVNVTPIRTPFITLNNFSIDATQFGDGLIGTNVYSASSFPMKSLNGGNSTFIWFTDSGESKIFFGSKDMGSSGAGVGIGNGGLLVLTKYKAMFGGNIAQQSGEVMGAVVINLTANRTGFNLLRPIATVDINGTLYVRDNATFVDNVTFLANITAPNICYSNGLNCAVNLTGNATQDGNNYTKSISWIVSGTNTTLNLSRNGAVDLLASFTDQVGTNNSDPRWTNTSTELSTTFNVSIDRLLIGGAKTSDPAGPSDKLIVRSESSYGEIAWFVAPNSSQPYVGIESQDGSYGLFGIRNGGLAFFQTSGTIFRIEKGGGYVADLQAYQALDISNNPSIQFDQRKLYATDGTTVNFDWANMAFPTLANGCLKTSNGDGTIITEACGSKEKYVLQTNVIANNITNWNTTVFNLTVLADKNYTMDCLLIVNSSAIGNGVQLNMTSTVTPSWWTAFWNSPTTATASSYDTFAGQQTEISSIQTAGLIGQGTGVTLQGRYENNATDGMLNLEVKNEVAGIVQVKKGSYCIMESD